MRKLQLQAIIKAVPEVQTLVLPADWFEHLNTSTDVFNAMYDWMVSGGKVPEDSKSFLPNRTYVGESLYRKLLAAEKKRLRAKLKINGDELDRTLGWSDLSSGPKWKIAGACIAGDAILVIPETSRETFNDFSIKCSRQARNEEIRKIRDRAAGTTYYQWLVSQADRPDHIGDTARDAALDESYPRYSNDYYELKTYLDSNACAAAVDCFLDGWLEYLEKYPHRITPMAWCGECGCKMEVADALLAWNRFGDLSVLDSECFESYRKFEKMKSRPLAGISTAILEDMREAGVSEVDIENVTRDLRLWGVLPPSDGPGNVYFIRAEDTHRIKIGFTAGHAEKRRKSLQTSNAGALTLLATIKGTQEYERDLHERFYAYRLNGEWFEPHPELLAFIAVLPPFGQ